MTTIINGSSPSVTFSDGTTQTTSAFGTGSNLYTTGTNIGIGTASPTGQLTTTGGVVFYAQTNTGFNNGLVLGTVAKATSSTSGQGSINIFSNDASNQLQGTISLVTDATAANRRLQIQAIEQGVAYRNITLVENGGNVAVGVTTANAKLTVTGGGSGPTVYFTQTATGSYAGIFDSVLNGATYYLVSFNAAGTQTGSIASNGTTTTYGVTSDYRLKENVAPMTEALETVAKLKPVTYTWKSNGSDGQGFIAHELQEIVPDCVVGDKDAVDADGKPRYQNIDTSFLVATLTAAIKEQQAIIESLTARIEALEAK
jgi:hypothetical protein